jgi:hypothetical protein
MMQFLDDVLLLSSRLALPDDAQLAKDFAGEALQLDESRARGPEMSADVGEAALVLAQARFAAQEPKAARDSASRASRILNLTLGADHALTRTAREWAASAPSQAPAISRPREST